ncbi:hypothetical protein [Roseibium sediminicola]|uniref:Uncharacterized protein n=1 Tax=Roseibium sediminicola TaxID=2933272 RepID=A0ABT0GPL1_9HYPH|nr:hypothetical protein [Roseibium sp. CAU 1639]MCK7610810.1 hypothetical protein [Roseibium sp. CAU 1639]
MDSKLDDRQPQQKRPEETTADTAIKCAPEDDSRGAQRSIREMVIDNNTRFAATMKSLGE